MLRAALLLTLWPVLALADNLWRLDREADGFKVELRDMPGSAFEEIRVTTTSPEPLQALCDAVWAKGVGAKAEGRFKKREVLSETDTERVTYEQISLPIVSDRDYVLVVKLLQPADTGRCEVSFSTKEDPSRPPADGHVRMTSVRGHWLLTPTPEGKVTVVYTVYSDPGGAVPPFLAKGSQREAAVDFLKTILARAKSRPAAP